ncbi:MAG: hypothetical protein ABI673_10720 [Novosphingobium sp.]
MVGRSTILAAILAAFVVCPAAAQSDSTPGVTEVAPGVRQIDGANVPSTHVGFAALKAAIEKDQSFKAAKKLFSAAGIASPGPSGTTTYMYKIHDPETNADGVAILFVKDGRVVNFMIS